MAKVSVIRCEDYDRIAVREALERHFDALGGLGRFVCAGEKVLLKPNLICPKPPHIPAQTHPAIICEAARALIAAGANVTVADSPAWSDTYGCLKALGIDKELLDMGARIAELNNPEKIRLPITGLKMGISRVALEADKIINLPKLKAHQQLSATIAVKNMFGAVAGKHKALWHYRQGDSTMDFAAMLLDIFLTLKPVLNIVDGIVAMQGQGPINGSAKKIGLLIASEDAIACEAVCARVIGLEDCRLPILAAAKELGIGCCDFNDIEFVGETIENYRCEDFLQAQLVPIKFTLPRICKSVIKQLFILLKGNGGNP